MEHKQLCPATSYMIHQESRLTSRLGGHIRRRIKTRTFQEGDLVLRLKQDHKGMHKLSSPWEGPYIISKKLNNGSYYLLDVREESSERHDFEDRLEAPRPWNVAHLRPYYT